MPKSEIQVKCNDGTRFKIVFDKRKACRYYTLFYRNDLKALRTVTGGLTKGKWLYLESQGRYSDVLAYMFDEIANIDAVEGD